MSPESERAPAKAGSPLCYQARGVRMPARGVGETVMAPLHRSPRFEKFSRDVSKSEIEIIFDLCILRSAQTAAPWTARYIS